MGNERANRILEARAAGKKPSPSVTREERDVWIHNKYQERSYADRPFPCPGPAPGAEMPSKTGFLNKLGGNVKNWKRRYFVLGTGAAGRQLSYYRSATDNSPLGIIPLVNCRVRLQVEGDRPCTFEVVTPARTYQLQAENSDEMRQWLSAVQEAAGSAAPDIVPCRGKLEGYLLKEGNARIKDWKRRWFVLDGGALTYYKKQHEAVPLGKIELGSCVAKVAENRTKRFCFEVATPLRSYWAAAESPDEMHKWIAAIRHASEEALTGGGPTTPHSPVPTCVTATTTTAVATTATSPEVVVRLRPQPPSPTPSPTPSPPTRTTGDLMPGGGAEVTGRPMTRPQRPSPSPRPQRPSPSPRPQRPSPSPHTDNPGRPVRPTRPDSVPSSAKLSPPNERDTHGTPAVGNGGHGRSPGSGRGGRGPPVAARRVSGAVTEGRQPSHTAAPPVNSLVSPRNVRLPQPPPGVSRAPEDNSARATAHTHPSAARQSSSGSSPGAVRKKVLTMASIPLGFPPQSREHSASVAGPTSHTPSLSSVRQRALSTEPKQGWLQKMGNNMRKDWRARYVVLDGERLQYYRSKLDGTPAGAIELVSCHVREAPEVKAHCMEVVTPSRSYYFAAEDRLELSEWMAAVQAAAHESAAAVAPLPHSPGGVLHEGWIWKQGKKGLKPWRRRWAVLKGDELFYYETSPDTPPLGVISVLLCTVKPSESGGTLFDVVTPQRSYHFQCKNKSEMMQWIAAIRGATEQRFTDIKHTPDDGPVPAASHAPALHVEEEEKVDEALLARLRALQALPANHLCADCGSSEPEWASTNLGIFVCIMCSGVHRSIGVHISKVRSVELDRWEEAMVDRMAEMGNERSNAAYEHHVPPEASRPRPSDPREAKELWIRRKYVECAFADPSQVQRQEVAKKKPVALFKDGWLTKQGSSVKNWKRRWFVLKVKEGSASLSYQKTRSDPTPAGVINIATAAVRATSAHPGHSFEVITPSRTYAIRAETAADKEAWVERLTEVVQLFE